VVHGGSKSSGGLKAGEVVQETKDIVLKNPVILLLFLLLGIFDFLNLTVLFFAHSFPFSKVLAPIIRRLWGDRFLYYPDNLFLLPKLFGYAHIVLLTTFGLFITAIVIKLIEAHVNGSQSNSSLDAAGIALKKYIGMAIVWVASFFALRFIGQWITAQIGHAVIIQVLLFWLVFLIFQSLIAFLFPALVLAPKGFFKPIAEGLLASIKHLFLLLKLLFIPVGISVGMSFAKAFAPAYIQVNPEIILVVMFVSVLVSTAVDLYITTVSAVSFLKVGTQKNV